jgi:hypothetical protein
VDQLARMGSLHPRGICKTAAGQAIRDKYWLSVLEQKHAKCFIVGPLLKELLSSQ